MLSTYPRQREWFLRGLLVVFGLSFPMFAAELAIRLIFDRYRCDEFVGWTYAAGRTTLMMNRSLEFAHLAHFNADGLRDVQHATEKPAGTFRIVVLGDSFSAGLQVRFHETFARQLERKLNEAALPNHRIEVLNAAVDGYGTGQELLFFRKRLARYAPDVVILGLLLANDLADNHLEAGSWNHYLAARCGRPYFELRDGHIELIDGGAPQRPPMSHLERFLRQSQLYATLVVDSRPHAKTVAFADWDVFSPSWPDAAARAWVLTQTLVLELARSIEESGSRFVVMLVPREWEGGVVPEKRSAWWTAMDFDRAHHLALGFMGNRGLRYIDLYPEFRAITARGMPVYYAGDMHWNAEGHALTARVIARWMCDHRGWLGVPIQACGQ